MPHPVTIAAAKIARDTGHPYPPDVIRAAAELYGATLEILDRRPVFGPVAETLALAMLTVTDYLTPDTVMLTLLRRARNAPADTLTRERFSR